MNYVLSRDGMKSKALFKFNAFSCELVGFGFCEIVNKKEVRLTDCQTGPGVFVQRPFWWTWYDELSVEGKTVNLYQRYRVENCSPSSNCCAYKRDKVFSSDVTFTDSFQSVEVNRTLDVIRSYKNQKGRTIEENLGVLTILGTFTSEGKKGCVYGDQGELTTGLLCGDIDNYGHNCYWPKVDGFNIECVTGRLYVTSESVRTEVNNIILILLTLTLMNRL